MVKIQSHILKSSSFSILLCMTNYLLTESNITSISYKEETYIYFQTQPPRKPPHTFFILDILLCCTTINNYNPPATQPPHTHQKQNKLQSNITKYTYMLHVNIWMNTFHMPSLTTLNWCLYLQRQQATVPTIFIQKVP